VPSGHPRPRWPLTSPPADLPLPAGFGIEPDPTMRQLDESTLFGGSPARALRLSAAGQRAWAELRQGPVGSAASGVLARRLTDAGLAHPRPPGKAADLQVTVIIPVLDRSAMLDRCLAALGGSYPVIVVDDGSADAAQVAAVAARHGATLHRRAHNGGPAAARNDGLALAWPAGRPAAPALPAAGRVSGDAAGQAIAFIDSDCVPPPGWLDSLAAHLADPLVGAVAPRIVAPAGRTSASRYAAACGSLDLGALEARVLPRGRVAYVPTAALLVRASALLAVSSGGEVFDPELRYGEDVDLVWRLHAAGWRIRYEPDVQVRHDGPASWPELLGRRFSYGTSAGPLARRHPDAMAPLVLQPWPALTVAALLAGRPLAAGLAAAAGWGTLTRTVRRAGLPANGALAATGTAVLQTWLGAGRYSTQFGAPALAAALIGPGGRTAAVRWGRRAAIGSLLLGPAVRAWRQARPARLGLVACTLAHIADDVAYGAGVWAGCASARTLVPVRPVIAWRPFRVTGTASGTGQASAGRPDVSRKAGPDGERLV
jgi:mycofactocin system glycosyltransferase